MDLLIREHELKCWPPYFGAIASGQKTFEIREKRKFAFEIGDVLWLREWNPLTNSYTGNEQRVEVTYLIDGAKDGFLPADLVVMGIKLLPAAAQPAKPQYAWAHYEEDGYHGSFDTEDKAVDDAIGTYFTENESIPDSVWVAELVPPREFLDPRLMGSWACEYLTERLEEEVGEVAENFKMTGEQEEALGKHILDWIEQNLERGFDCFGIKNGKEIKRPVKDE